MPGESSPSSQKRPTLRLVSIAVLVGVGGLSLAGCLLTRGVVADQESKLLQQRTEEAGVALGSGLGAVQTQLSSLASAFASTNKDTKVFQQAATLMTKAPGGFSSVAVVKQGATPTIVNVAGAPMSALPAPAVAALNTAAAKSGPAGSLVATPLFDGDKSARRLGWVFVSPTLGGHAIYAESLIRSQTQSPATSSAPFAELVAAVY